MVLFHSSDFSLEKQQQQQETKKQPHMHKQNKKQKKTPPKTISPQLLCIETVEKERLEA